MRESELSLGLFRANCGLFGPIGAYFLRENADSTQIGGVQPCPRMGDTAHLGSAQSAERSALLQPSSAHFPHAPNIEVEQHDRDGCLLSEQFDAPVIDSLERLTLPCRVALEKLAGDPRSKKKIAEEAMRQAILAVCRGHFVALSTLAELLKRDPDALRQQHLKPLTKEGKLRLAFPTAPTHAKQAYRSAE